jgi:hypothetical protein
MLTKCVFIQRHRHLQERRAREGHQSHSIRFGQLPQVLGRQLGFLESVGGDVLSQHASGGVDADHDVEPALFDLLVTETPLRPTQGDERQRHCRAQQDEAQFLSGLGNPDREGW